MSTLIHEQRDERLVLRRLRRMQRIRRRRQRRTEMFWKRALEILGWLTAILILIYASHAAFAQTRALLSPDGPAAAETRASTPASRRR